MYICAFQKNPLRSKKQEKHRNSLAEKSPFIIHLMVLRKVITVIVFKVKFSSIQRIFMAYEVEFTK